MPLILTGTAGTSTLDSSTGLAIATWTTGTRPSSPLTGQMGYNTTTSAMEYWNGTAWNGLGSNSYVYAATVLTVGGGAGATGGVGGVNYGSGGAGGILRSSSINLTIGTVYTAIVGAGGTGISVGTPGSGGTSLFTGATSATGGIGLINTSFAGGNNADFSGAPGPGSTASGGGAGAGANGSGINGGNGAASSITGSSVTYGGGGGGVNSSGSGGSGGSGGGGAGAGSGNGTNGTANLGGGAGGSPSGNFASGGSGVVILSVPTSAYSGTTTGSPTVTTSGSNTIIRFTSSGSYTA